TSRNKTYLIKKKFTRVLHCKDGSSLLSPSPNVLEHTPIVIQTNTTSVKRLPGRLT
ncbi:hypothetical protein L9F63_005312, partial [Diploptera punctata]